MRARDPLQHPRGSDTVATMSFTYAQHISTDEPLATGMLRAISCELEHLNALTVRQRTDRDINVIAAKVTLNLRETSVPGSIATALPLLASLGAVLHVALVSSDQYDRASSPRAMPVASAIITQLARLATAHHIRVALSPRAGHWMERIEDAVRVAMRVNRPEVGVVFNTGDWHRVDGDVSMLDQRIKLALPKLLAVTVPVRGLSTEGHWQPVTLGDEPMDMAPLNRLLVSGGFTGPIILEPLK